MTGQEKVITLVREKKQLQDKLNRAEEREMELLQKIADQQSEIVQGKILINLHQGRLQRVNKWVKEVGLNIYV